MIVIINGPCGIGKTSAAWELQTRFERSVMLDGDHIGAVHPFEIYDDARIFYLYRTLRYLIEFHITEGGYEHFVINYVFESPASLRRLREMLAPFGKIYAFRLTAEDAAIERRIHQRGGEDAPWHLERYKELQAILSAAARRGDVGFPIDTTGLSVAEVVDRMWQRIHEPVVVAPYDPSWPVRFAVERARVAEALGDLALDIQHVGSTAAPGLAAKPIIDLLVLVRDLADATACIAPLSELGYIFVDHVENLERRFFRKGMPRTHHLHIVEAGSREARDTLAFRDALRADPELRAAYARLKRDLAAQNDGDRLAYTRGKTAFVRAALARHRAGRGS